MSELAALKRSCWNDKTPNPTGRLIMADWLYENGYEREAIEQRIVAEPDNQSHYDNLADWYSSNGDPYRGIFIRDRELKSIIDDKIEELIEKEYNYNLAISVAISMISKKKEEWRKVGVCKDCKGKGHLGNQETEGSECDACWGSGDVGGLLRRFEYYITFASSPIIVSKIEQVQLKWHNGVIVGVKCSWNDIVDYTAQEYDANSNTWYSYVPSEWAKAVIKYHPTVQEFIIDSSERRPAYFRNMPSKAQVYSWVKNRGEHGSSVTEPVWNFLNPKGQLYVYSNTNERMEEWLDYRTIEEANSSFWSAIALWVRYYLEA